MNTEMLDSIVKAILYEGYILYPYRPSALKNRQRWNFGVLYPASYCAMQSGTDAHALQAECLLLGDERTQLGIVVRFLHPLMREVGKIGERGEDCWEIVEALEVDGQIFYTWQEAVERSVHLVLGALGELLGAPRTASFNFPANRRIEFIRDRTDRAVGVLIRRQHAISGGVEVSLERLDAGVFKATARVENRTAFDGAGASRDEALLRSLASAHVIFEVRGGEFISLLDPPAELRAHVAACRNVGVWPVLVGEPGARDLMLASPIILYDYPRVAPESAGDLFDGTEIDELLSLRILTLTDEEKREARAADERARALLERTESLHAGQMLRLHGAIREMRPVEGEEATDKR
ncbi:hypothetical protein [Pyrinomonas methylaliphatogenes]|uniref:Uncharacterized protein n=1 Tax=Pyrinomonas methylaliphatogenes TaxID=454194 RepID=A0A0B6X443_9BACT|nr:hypothetical protein [Pyrinomonas methylaliphatogenes]CDM67020.1 hypothetical protein PYK22_03069 [Pyrinomonas methylaliphatogenes]